MIDATNILQLDLLDLLFDGRNKNYGAYELRKNYRKRMLIAVTVTLFCCLLLFLLFTFASRSESRAGSVITDPILVNLKPTQQPQPQVIPPPPPKAKVPEVKIKQFTTPLITKQDVKPDEQPPENKDLETAKIGKVNVDGADDVGLAPQPSGDNKGVIDIPKKPKDDDDGIVMFVQIESQYPGGVDAWRYFLQKNLQFPSSASENGIEGTVIVQFIVDRTGAVSDVEAVSGPNELREEAVRVIKKSGKWTPAIQNGRQVKSYKKQPITFKLQTD
jgi:protein TonB